jgi:hypothetical protein
MKERTASTPSGQSNQRLRNALAFLCCEYLHTQVSHASWSPVSPPHHSVLASAIPNTVQINNSARHFCSPYLSHHVEEAPDIKPTPGFPRILNRSFLKSLSFVRTQAQPVEIHPTPPLLEASLSRFRIFSNQPAMDQEASHQTRRALSADFPKFTKSSMLYSMLPTAVQFRLPRIPSLRRSGSMYGLPTRRILGLRSRSNSGSTTPDTEYQENMALGLFTQEEQSSSLVLGNGGTIREDVSARNVALQMHNGQGVELGEEKSGVGWKFAHQGRQNLGFFNGRCPD